MINWARWILTLIIGAATAFCGGAGYSVYPDHPVHFVLGSAVGGSNDLTVRLIATELSEMWGQPVLVENRPSDSNVLAMEIVAKAKPDGYTLLSVNNNFTITASQMKLEYDPIKSFTPITELALMPMLLMAHPASPVKTLKEFVDYAKSKPGRLPASATVGTSGIVAARVSELIANALTEPSLTCGTASDPDAKVIGISPEITAWKTRIPPR